MLADWALGDIQVIWERAELGVIEEKPLPLILAHEEYFVRNCTQSSQSGRDETITVSYVETDTVTVTEALTTNGALKFELPLANAQINFSKAVSVTQATTAVQQHARSETIVERIMVPATTALLYKYTKRGMQITAPFYGECVVDAKLLTRHRDGHLLPFTFGMLSDRYPPESRRYKTSGSISLVRGKRIEKTFLEKKLDPNNPRDCENIPNLPLSVQLIRLNNQPLLLDTMETPSSPMLAAREVTSSLFDGMSITTCNCVGNVQVRAKSLGPGFCDTRISSSPQSVQISAPPLTWSTWEVLSSHIGSVTFSISVDAKCDTGALFEVKYFAA